MSSCPTFGEIFVEANSGHVMLYTAHSHIEVDSFLSNCKAWSYYAVVSKRIIDAHDPIIEKSKHSPGPWNAFKAMSSICVGDSEPVERIEDLHKGMHIEVFGEKMLENARMIAAAPEMYELLYNIYNSGEMDLDLIHSEIFHILSKIQPEFISLN